MIGSGRGQTGEEGLFLERDVDALDELLGALTGVYADFDLDALRDEWA